MNPPVLPLALRSTVPPWIPELPSQALTVRASVSVPFKLAVGRRYKRVLESTESNLAELGVAVKAVQLLFPKINKEIKEHP